MSDTSSTQNVHGWDAPPTWKATWPRSVSVSEVNENVNSCGVEPRVTDWEISAVNGGSASCTLARTPTGIEAEAVNDSWYDSPLMSGMSFCPMMASHGLTVPAGTVAHS